MNVQIVLILSFAKLKNWLLYTLETRQCKIVVGKNKKNTPLSDKINKKPQKGVLPMNTNTIILKKCEKFIQEILEFFSENKIRGIEEMETCLKQLTHKFILGMIKSYLEALDKAIVEDKAGRKQKGIIIERKNDKRELYTIFGNLIFKRTYFYDKRRCEYLYLLDKVVGLEGYELLTRTVELNLAEHASQYSYAKSSQNVTGGEVSQTVMLKLRKSFERIKKRSTCFKA